MLRLAVNHFFLCEQAKYHSCFFGKSLNLHVDRFFGGCAIDEGTLDEELAGAGRTLGVI
jgi:hypothetical protein